MSTTTTTGAAGYDRRRALQEFDDTKAGVKGLVDAGVTIVPPIFHHPPDSLPTSSSSVAIPVIDLSSSRSDVVAQVNAAAETVGFFQVVSHGVPAGLLAETLASVRRFHESPAEAKAPYYTRDLGKKLRFNSNFDLFQSPAANWRDTLFCQAFPDMPGQDELPPAVRGVLLDYSGAARRLAVRVLGLLSEGLGLAPDGLEEMGCADGVSLVGNYYPPCPEPRLILGTSRHSDPAFLTVLLQDYDMTGLQVLVVAEDYDGGSEERKRWVWADVPPVPGALVINVGDLLQLVSNGKLRSVEHRVVANGNRDNRARVSVAAFCNADLSTTATARVYGRPWCTVPSRSWCPRRRGRCTGASRWRSSSPTTTAKASMGARRWIISVFLIPDALIVSGWDFVCLVNRDDKSNVRIDAIPSRAECKS